MQNLARVFFIAMAAALAWAMSAAGQDGPRLALVIGNEAYPAGVGALARPHEDIEEMGAALSSVGFDVTPVRDADRDTLLTAVLNFADRLNEAGEGAVGFFYYAGHGASTEVAGRRRNFLIPAQTTVTNPRELRVRGVRLDEIISSLADTRAGTIFVVSDACRNTLRWSADRSSPRGFAVEQSRPGMFIALATSEDETTPDDGLFATALAEQLRQPGQTAERSFTLAFREVARSRDDYRLPTAQMALREDFCFAGCALASNDAASGNATRTGPALSLADARSRLTGYWRVAETSGEDWRIEFFEDGRLAQYGGPGVEAQAEGVYELEEVDGAFQITTRINDNEEFAPVRYLSSDALMLGAVVLVRSIRTDDAEAPPEVDVSETVPSEDERARLIREAQTLLADMGYEPGPADGQPGARTSAAVRAFRAAIEFGEGDEINEALLETMRVSSRLGHRADAGSSGSGGNAPSGAGMTLPDVRAMAPSLRAPVISPGTRMQPYGAFRDCDDCPDMVVVPAGSFTIGSPASEAGRESDEGPQRTVTIAEPFAVGRFEVTGSQFAAFVGSTGHEVESRCRTMSQSAWDWSETANWLDPGFRQPYGHPVVCVGWEDAQVYVRWLSTRSGTDYRLLTEAEWEYAARAGTRTPYPWGAAADHEQANFGADRCCAGASSGRDRWRRTSPVGRFDANAFGLHDMLGNVSEWVEDCYFDGYAAGPTDAQARRSQNCTLRVSRGGAWSHRPNRLRSAERLPSAPTDRTSNLGFRVARDID